jgi:hypothetical protein
MALFRGISGIEVILILNSPSVSSTCKFLGFSLLVIDLSGRLTSGEHPLIVAVYDGDRNAVDLQATPRLAPGEEETLTVVLAVARCGRQ